MPTNQGKTIETELHHVIANIQEAVENREVTLGAFLHIKGAFDSTSFDITERLSNGMGMVKLSVAGLALFWWHEYYSCVCRRKSAQVCGQSLSTGRHLITFAVEPGHRRTHRTMH